MKEDFYLPGEISMEPWMGGILHKVMIDGCCAWIVEPPTPSKTREWFWVPEWPDAFPERNGVKELLEMGFIMLYVNVFGKFANEEALKVMHSLYTYIISLDFAKKGAFIGMSMGGLYSFRFAEKYPDVVTCIYADAPVCDLNWRDDSDFSRDDGIEVCRAYGEKEKIGAMKNHPLSPVNNYKNMVKHGIPLLLILGLDDKSVNPEKNGLLLADRWQKAGGEVKVITRPLWGHHPHGLDHPAQIVRFVTEHAFR